MTRRQLAAVLTFSGLIVSAGPVALLFTPRRPCPCLATFNRVQVGMTRGEVVAAVGGPPGCYSTRIVPVLRFHDQVLYDDWIGRDGQMWVEFGPDDRVEKRVIFEGIPWPPRYRLMRAVAPYRKLRPRLIPAERR